MQKTKVRQHTLLHPVTTRPTKVRASNRHFANVVPRGIPYYWTHTSLAVRHFVKEYSLPVILTGVFLVLVLVASLLRMTQHASLAKLLTNVTSITQDYESLVSRDKTDAPVRGNVHDESTPSRAPTGSTSSFAINSGGTTTSTPPPTGDNGGGMDTTPPPPPPFSAAIGFFQQDSGTLSCNNPNNPKLQTCSKVYAFSAGVNTISGPGTVNYGWRSNISGASQDASYSAVTGTSQRTLQKSVTIDCLSPGSYSMQFVILSPSQVQSSTLSINHNCVGI